eukprot:scaffold10670_cov60-Cyclotella_meneghiniana.AAC.8
MLKYFYGDTSAFKVFECNRAVINAADKYHVDNLKLYAEKCYVDWIELNADNVAGMLLYADGKSCNMLKNAAMANHVNFVFQSLPIRIYYERNYGSHGETSED